MQAQGMLSFDQTVRGTLIRGMLPDAEDKVADLPSTCASGGSTICSRAFGIVLGADLARALRVSWRQGDADRPQGLVTPAAILPRSSSSGGGHLRGRDVRYDSSLAALVHLQDAQTLYRMEDRVSGVRLKLDDLFRRRGWPELMQLLMDADTLVPDWTAATPTSSARCRSRRT